MENSKPTYEQLEQELNEYKDLLWQLSDEYRTNMGNIEKKLEEETKKTLALETNVSKVDDTPKPSFIFNLGLPACIIANDGKILQYNNKFKFLVELLGGEIEETAEIAALIKRDKTEDIEVKVKNYLNSDESYFQSLFRVENSFQNLINIVFRLYKQDAEQSHLALFIELHKTEISGLAANDAKQETLELPKTENNPELELLRTELALFSEKYEVYTEVARLFENSELNTTESLHNAIKQTFDLESTRSKLIDKLNVHYRDFLILMRQKYPDLTPNEEKHCMLIRAGLTYKEISSVMDISVNGVKIARNRLRKKLDLENDTRTSEFIENV